MPRQAKNIIVSCKGEGVKVNYWAGGHGRKVEGYLTSFHQLQSELNKYFHARSLELYTLVNRKAVHITSESRLKQALAIIPSGEYLLVYAYGHRELHNSTKFVEQSPFTVTTHLKHKPTFRSKRSQSKNADAPNLHKRLEHLFPA